jgi:hypothetical protein
VGHWRQGALALLQLQQLPRLPQVPSSGSPQLQLLEGAATAHSHLQLQQSRPLLPLPQQLQRATCPPLTA